jgi:hypothetical protein
MQWSGKLPNIGPSGCLGLQDVIIMPGMIRDKLLLRQYLCTVDVLLSPEPPTPLNN